MYLIESMWGEVGGKTEEEGLPHGLQRCIPCTLGIDFSGFGWVSCAHWLTSKPEDPEVLEAVLDLLEYPSGAISGLLSGTPSHRFCWASTFLLVPSDLHRDEPRLQRPGKWDKSKICKMQTKKT